MHACPHTVTYAVHPTPPTPVMYALTFLSTCKIDFLIEFSYPLGSGQLSSQQPPSTLHFPSEISPTPASPISFSDHVFYFPRRHSPPKCLLFFLSWVTF